MKPEHPRSVNNELEVPAYAPKPVVFSTDRDKSTLMKVWLPPVFI